MDEGIADFLHELGQLKRVRRSGWWLAGVDDAESVAEHTFRVAAVAYILARLEGADLGRSLAMAIFHDAAEARVNDPHRLARSYIEWAGVEERVAADQTRRLPEDLGESLRGLLAEVRAKNSLEARIVKDSDRIECLLQAREYAEQGHRVEDWVRSSVEELETASGRRLAKAILATGPGKWRGPRGA